MPISDRDQALFEDLTRQFGTGCRLGGWLVNGERGITGPLAMAVAGMAALPAGIAANVVWVGLVGFLVAVPATARLLAGMPRPNRGWFRARGLLPTVAFVDRRRYDGTMVTRRTFILPGRLIVVLLVVILVPLVIATAVTQPEKTLPVGDSDVGQPQLPEEARGSRPVQMSTRGQPAEWASSVILA